MNTYAYQKNVHGLIAVLVAVGGCIAAANGPVWAQTAAAAPATFAVVDTDELIKGSNAWKKGNEDMRGYVAKLQGAMGKLREGGASLLPDPQIRELATLYEKDTLTDADKKRMAELEQLASGRHAEMAQLENNAAPTADQTKRLHDLNDMQAQGGPILEGPVTDLYKQDIQDKTNDFQTQVFKDIRAAIAVVAKQKAITVVFNSTVALYATTDLTADVLKQVNK